MPTADNWECEYQPSTQVAGGRPDLRLRPGKDSYFSKPIDLESKVGSPLKKEQLKNYKDHGTKILAAVTKNRPEVSYKELCEIGVKSLRWQDFCRALRQTAIAGQKEKFLCQSFAEYLEDSGMAYQEDITTKHLNDIAVLLKTITSTGYRDYRPRQSFNYAHSCLGLLGDVRASLYELLPKLDRWSCWGPGYFHSGEERWHYFALSFAPIWRVNHPSHRWFRGGLKFDVEKDTIQWAVAWYHPRKNGDSPDEIPHTIASVSSPIADGRKALDIEKMSKTMVEDAQKWKIDFIKPPSKRKRAVP